MAGTMDCEKRLQLDIKIDSIFSKLSLEDTETWRSAKRNSDRIEVVYRNADLFHREIPVTDEKSLGDRRVWNRAGKSAFEAEELRRQGNEYFAKGRYLKAIERYSAAIVRAPIDDDDDDLVSIRRGCSASHRSTEDLGGNDQVGLPGSDGSDDDSVQKNDSKKGTYNSEEGLKKGCSNSKDGSKEGISNSKEGLKKSCSNSKDGSKEGISNSKEGLRKSCSNSKEGLKKSCSNSEDGSKEGSSNSKKSSRELALAFANRSAALFHLKQWEEAIRDIDYSLRFGYPQDTRYKLYERRAKVFLELGRRQDAARDASEACKHLRETVPDGPVRKKHLIDLEALRQKCKGAGGTLEMGERQEVGEKRKVGEMDEKEEQQKGLDSVWTIKNQGEERNRYDGDSRKEDDHSKRFKERYEGGAQASKEADDRSKENTCIKCKRVGDGCRCWDKTKHSQDRPNFFPSLGGHPRSGSVASRVPPEPDFESFFAGVEVRRSELCGRYTVSKENIRVGSVIANMRPFASVLFSDCHSTHCFHCFREAVLPFPCYKCSQVVFCDERCSLAAWNAYHWAECGWMRWMNFDLVGRLGHLAYRVLVAAGLKNVLKVFMGTCGNDQEKVGSVENSGNSETGIDCKGSKETSDSADNGSAAAVGIRSEAPVDSGASSESRHNPCSGSGSVCGTDDYAKMMRELVRHESSRAPSDDLGFCIIAFVLVQLSKMTGWLSSDVRRIQTNLADQEPLPDSRLDEERREKAVFTALLHHIQAIQCNGFEISEMRPMSSGQTGSNVLQRHRIHHLGIGLYPDLAIVNHSCDPTVDVVFHGNEATIRAIRNIQSSEEVTVDYGRLFFIQNKSTRQSFLRGTYFFDCRCLPCLESWPLWEDLPASELVIKCPGCGVRLSASAASAKGCSKCGRVFGKELTKAVIRLDNSHRRYVEMMRGMDCAAGRSPEAVTLSELERGVAVVEDHLNTMQELLCLPWRNFYSCQATLRQFYRIMANISSQPASG